MTTLSWTVPMYLSETRPEIQVNNEELCHAMVHKAQDPAKYVPYITGCEVLEEYEDGLLRDITYADGRSVRERVVYEAPTRMTFQAHNDPDVAEIVKPTHVGRSSVRDVVLSPTNTAHQWQLRVDTTHTVLFDHPHDHVPGMVLLEAADQIARAEAQPQAAIPVAFDTTFRRYVEFDRPCVLTAEPVEPDAQGRSRVLVSASQADQVVFRTTVTTEPGGTRWTDVGTTPSSRVAARCPRGAAGVGQDPDPPVPG
ncbi:AtaL-like protein, partial [Streptomyces cyaneofuscatus]|uniref:AtaL-like protein n=1 Tax=Streptomyces cyaneofuscatus TaxID=66883 RepID=UPI00365C1824